LNDVLGLQVELSGRISSGTTHSEPDRCSSSRPTTEGHRGIRWPSTYRQGFDDDRLQAIVNVVRGWLYAKPVVAKKTAPKKSKAKPVRRERQRQQAALRVGG
jgi:hypothetical protein